MLLVSFVHRTFFIHHKKVSVTNRLNSISHTYVKLAFLLIVYTFWALRNHISLADVNKIPALFCVLTIFRVSQESMSKEQARIYSEYVYETRPSVNRAHLVSATV